MKNKEFIQLLVGKTIESVELTEGYDTFYGPRPDNYEDGFTLNFSDGTNIEFEARMCQGEGHILVLETEDEN